MGIDTNQCFPRYCWDFANLIHANAGRAVFVGGCIRDIKLGISTQDFDVEVFGIGQERLQAILEKHFKHINLFGQKFGVYKIKNPPLDVSLPRTEIIIGCKHRDFSVHLNPYLSYEEAARRRDFTVNTMGFDILANTLLDPFHGENDLSQATLRHVSTHFAEDALRVLRGMQLAGRFGFKLADETQALCQSMSPQALSEQKIFEEFYKLFSKSSKPSRGLIFLERVNWLRYFGPLYECQQKFPSEWLSILHAIDQASRGQASCELVYAILLTRLQNLHLATEEFFQKWITNGKILKKVLRKAQELRSNQGD